MRRISTVVSIALMLVFCSGAIHCLHALDVGVAWVGKSGMAENVMKGFEDGIKGMNINLEYQKDLPSNEALAKVIERFTKEKGGILVLRSPCAEWLVKNPPAVPTFIAACNNPSQLGVIKNLKSPEGKITGVTYYIPAKINMDIFRAILPQMKTVYLLMEKGHPSAEIEEQETKVECAKLGVTYNGKMCTSIDEVTAAVKQNSGKVSCFIIGSQAMIMDNAARIVNAAGKTPVFSYSEKPIKSGALGGYVADDKKLGRILAGQVVDVLVKHKAVKDTPVRFDPEPVFYLNGLTYKKLGLEIPPNVLGSAKIIQ